MGVFSLAQTKAKEQKNITLVTVFGSHKVRQKIIHQFRKLSKLPQSVVVICIPVWSRKQRASKTLINKIRMTNKRTRYKAVLCGSGKKFAILNGLLATLLVYNSEIIVFDF